MLAGMPTTAARDRLLEALLALTADRGLEAVSIREVAAAAGLSIGAVQYYCHSKDQMLKMAFEEVNRRILTRAQGIEKTGLVGDVLRRAVLEFLPLDDRRREEAVVYLAFSARAAVSAELAAVRHAMIAEQQTLCADTFRLAQARGEAIGDLDADQAAWATVTVVDGLLLNLLSDPGGLADQTAIELLDDHLRRYLQLSATVDLS
jgi:AcrR family transcriptional regulator